MYAFPHEVFKILKNIGRLLRLMPRMFKNLLRKLKGLVGFI